MQPRRAAILALLAVTQLIGVLDFSIVNVALPSIQREFELPPDQLQWVVSAYALTLGGFLLLGGQMADLFDRKLVFMRGLSVFAAASLAGGLAPTAIWCSSHEPCRASAARSWRRRLWLWSRPSSQRVMSGIGP